MPVDTLQPTDENLNSQFELAFGCSILDCYNSTTRGFDLIDFKNYCKQHLGYREFNEGSLQEFIVSKSSQEMKDYIATLTYRRSALWLG